MYYHYVHVHNHGVIKTLSNCKNKHEQLWDVCHIPVRLQVFPTSMPSHIYHHKCVRHVYQDKCLRDQNWYFECSCDFHHQIMIINENWGQLLTTITQILVRLVIVAVKYVSFMNVYTTSLLKSSLCLRLCNLWLNYYKCNGITGHDNYVFC